MSDSDWKQKYRDSLLEMEAEEKRWRQIEQALRRLIGRLCAAAMGVDAQLDDELTTVAAANRRNADAQELESLAASLTTAVVAVDTVAPIRAAPLHMPSAAPIPPPASAVSPAPMPSPTPIPPPPFMASPAPSVAPLPSPAPMPSPTPIPPPPFMASPAPSVAPLPSPAPVPSPTPIPLPPFVSSPASSAAPLPSPAPMAGATGRWGAACIAAGKVLGCLRSVGVDESVTLDLIAQLGRANSDAELAGLLDRTAELVSGHGESLARERLQAATVLADVTQRLGEVAGYLSESGLEARTRFADTASLNDTVMSQVNEISAEINAATELGVLQSLVAARLETVTRQVLDFRSREERRLLEHTGRAERMRNRIADLEREAQELHSKLDREKHGARLDPLTRLANRKSFDERFARELLRRSHNDVQVNMLLWDLDNFKSINDTYGHRAGDRVLQTVAGCFLSGLRTEDFVARIGGEEFVILLSGMPFANARQVADELRRGVEALRFHFRGTPVKVTVSCGLTELKAGEGSGAAFDRADAALYQAKNSGKNACIAA